MRVVWVQDFNIFAAQGGAEQSDLASFKTGLARGHDMALYTPDVQGNAEGDLAIISNATRFPRPLLEAAIKGAPYVAYLHDYWPLCRFRLYYPGPPCKDHSYIEFAKRFVLGSKLNVFLSPLHLQSWAQCIPEVLDHPYYLHPSPVDVSMFQDLHVTRIHGSVLGVNCLLSFKGGQNVLQYATTHPDLMFTVIGATDGQGNLPPNVRYLGPIPAAQLPEMYSQAESFIHLPATPQPCERTAIEARLCGVRKFILNDLVGVTSYDEWNLPLGKFRRWIRDAPTRFWDAVENVMKGEVKDGNDSH